MKPLLAHVYEPHRVTYPCYVQPKLNGIRALYQNGSFQSRDQLPFPAGLLAHLATPLQGIFGPEVILDGELYVHGWSLQRINAAVTPVRQQPTEDTVQVQYHVFDRVDYQWSFHDRYANGIQLPLVGSVCRVHTRRVESELQADVAYAEFVEKGYEGCMYRLGNCPYTTPKQLTWKHSIGGISVTTFGAVRVGGRAATKFLSDKDNRVWHLLKRKDWQDDEFECISVVEGEGKLQGMLGALHCRTGDEQCLDDRFSVGSGLTDAERAHYWTNPPIGRLIKVKYLCLSDAGVPLNPTILAIL